MKQYLVNSFFTKSLIFAVSLSFITHTRIVNNLLYFDLFIILYVTYYFVTNKIKIDKVTFIQLFFLNGFLILSLIALPFVTDIKESFLFIIQYLFTFNILPLFIYSLIQSNHFNYFLKNTFFVLFINSLLFIFYSVYNIFIQPGYNFLYFGLSGLNRFSWGDGIVSNDLIHYYIFALFIIWYQIKRKNQILKWLFFFFSYLFTLSRTLVLVSFIFFIFRFNIKKLALLAVLLTLFVIIIINSQLAEQMPNVQRLIYFSSLDYSSDQDMNNQGRLNRMKPIFNNFEDFLLFPLFGNPNNMKFDSSHSVSSVHNALLSIIVNFGILPFLLIIVTALMFFLRFIAGLKKDDHVGNKYLLGLSLFVVLDLTVISFNALMTSRALWLPFFVYMYLISDQLHKGRSLKLNTNFN